MRYHDPDRPHLPNGNPCWLSAPSVALPGLYIEPAASDMDNNLKLVSIGVVIDGSWCYNETIMEALLELFDDWANDPEGALRRWFKIEPPEGRSKTWNEPQAAPVISSVNAEDLGL